MTPRDLRKELLDGLKINAQLDGDNELMLTLVFNGETVDRTWITQEEVEKVLAGKPAWTPTS